MLHSDCQQFTLLLSSACRFAANTLFNTSISYLSVLVSSCPLLLSAPISCLINVRMPSKYSHALVVSHYESQGFIHRDGPSNKAGSRISFASARSTPVQSTQRPKRADTVHSSRSSPATPHPFSLPRIRLGTATPYTRIEASPPPLHRRNSSVETQVFAPPSPPPSRENLIPSHVETRPQTPKHKASIETQIYNPQSPRSSQSSIKMTDWSHSSEVKARRRAAHLSSPNRSRPVSRNKVLKESGNKAPQKPQTPPLTHPSREDASAKARAFIPPHPPSPPATPDSGKSFGLDTFMDRIDKATAPTSVAANSPEMTNCEANSDLHENNASQDPVAVSFHKDTSSESLVILPHVPPNSGKSFGLKNHLRISEPTDPAPPVSESSVRRTLSMVPRSDQNPLSPQSPPIQSSPSKIKQQRAYHSPTFSITTQPSSRGFMASPTFDFRPEPLKLNRALSLHSPTFSITSPTMASQVEPSRPSTSRSAHGPRFSISTRRSSLNFSNGPPDLNLVSSMPSEVYFEDDADLESLPSDMDFDSLPWTDLNADPVGFHNVRPGDRRWSASSRGSSVDSAEPPPIRRAPNYPMFSEKTASQSLKKSRQSLAALLFSRSPAHPPKAILYCETMPGPPPIPVHVSGKGISSNTALFSTTPNQFPPLQKSEERVGRRMSGTSSVPYAPPRRGVSQSAAERGNRSRHEADRTLGHGHSLRRTGY